MVGPLTRKMTIVASYCEIITSSCSPFIPRIRKTHVTTHLSQEQHSVKAETSPSANHQPIENLYSTVPNRRAQVPSIRKKCSPQFTARKLQ